MECMWCKIREEEVKKLREELAKRNIVPQASVQEEEDLSAQTKEEKV